VGEMQTRCVHPLHNCARDDSIGFISREGRNTFGKMTVDAQITGDCARSPHLEKLVTNSRESRIMRSDVGSPLREQSVDSTAIIFPKEDAHPWTLALAPPRNDVLQACHVGTLFRFRQRRNGSMHYDYHILVDPRQVAQAIDESIPVSTEVVRKAQLTCVRVEQLIAIRH
jgi:hypothetical protein